MSYWNSNGKYQNEYERLYDDIVPASGSCETREGEMLRASSRLYYRYYNDGDMVLELMPEYMKDCSALNATAFLYHQVETRERIKELLKSKDENEYIVKLEEIADIVIQFVSSRNGKYQNGTFNMFDKVHLDNFPVDFEIVEEDDDDY